MRTEIDDIQLKAAIKKQQTILQKLSGQQVQLAQASALNKTAAKLKTLTYRESAKSLKMKQSSLRDISQETKKERVKIIRAKAAKLSAGLNVAGKAVMLGKLNPVQLKKAVKVGQSKYADSFIAKPSLTPKGLTKGRGNVPAAFVGKQQVLFRKGKERYGLKARYKWVKSTLQAVMNKHARLMMQRETAALLKREYDYRIGKELAKIK